MRVLPVEDDPATSNGIKVMPGHASLNVYATDPGTDRLVLAPPGPLPGRAFLLRIMI
ncbi:MAG: hypothetical protein GDA52_05010 [Rhodobacteraceae bacterium]|nr:hypothetical protein [Paracoccaceae bacterium]